MRISDFNTKGLYGVAGSDRNTPFYNLTKGSGISNKSETDGGSKGIGKYATFVTSATNTVFYSTLTELGESGYIGICKLRSRAVGENIDDLTEGKGYYALGDANYPIRTELVLDKNFSRDGQSGTDIYIIGFKNNDDWKEIIIAKILESFMVAILNNKLIVKVEDIEINASTLKEVLEGDILNGRGKKERKDILAQYDLLTQGEEDGVYSKNIELQDGEIKVYVKKYGEHNIADATKQCVMVRYPYMKILYYTGYSYMPYSALCIIEKNELNKKLRYIENPQHDAWEIKRLNDEPELKNATKKSKKEMDYAIRDFINYVLQQTSSEPVDMEGASQYLPSEGIEETLKTRLKENDSDGDSLSISIPKRVTTKGSKTLKVDMQLETYDFDYGGDGTEDGIKTFNNLGEEVHPNPYPNSVPSDDNQGSVNGDKSILKQKALSGIKYDVIVTNRKLGNYQILFTSPYTEDKCKLLIYQFGSSTDKYKVEIVSARLDDISLDIVDGEIVNLKLNQDQKYILICKLNSHEMFAGEVVLYAYR